MRLWPTALLLTALAAPAPTIAQSKPIEAARTDVPAGDYKLDRAHTSVTFRVSHIGLSRYTARFTGIDARLRLDPADPTASSLTATIDAKSLETDYPFTDVDFDALIQGKSFLEAGKFPKITFRSTRIELTAPDKARVTGDLTLHGVTRPVTLSVTFNGGYAGHKLDPAGSRIGFSARGTLKRSEFGMTLGLPLKGSKMGVGDEVEILIETEFTRPRPDPGKKPAE